MTENLTDRFIDLLFPFCEMEFSDSILLQAKRCLIDYLGVTYAGAKLNKDKTEKLLKSIGTNLGGLIIIGYPDRVAILNAALINGLNSHIAELDDGERFGMFHPGSPILSALLPFVEQEKLSGADLLKGIIIGYEAAIRVARALQPNLKDRGFHATGICGTIGAAVACASSLSLTASQIKNSFSAAASGASGMLKVIEDDSSLKPYNAGHAALNGLLAVSMSRAGFQGPDDILGGKRGLLSIFTGQFDASLFERKEDDAFMIERIYTKPYAACRHSHPAIEAALKIRQKTGVDPEEIRDINIRTYRWAVEGHDHINVGSMSSAKMSTPYSVAAALVTGRAGLNEYNPQVISNEKIKSLCCKIKIFSDDSLTALVPHKRAAIVEVFTADSSYTERVDIPKGEPETPLSDQEIIDKFTGLAAYANKMPEQISDIIKHVMQIEKSLDKFFEVL